MPKRATGGCTRSDAAGAAAKARVWPRKARWGAAARAERSNACRENMVSGGGLDAMGDLECREASSVHVFRDGVPTWLLGNLWWPQAEGGAATIQPASRFAGGTGQRGHSIPWHPMPTGNPIHFFFWAFIHITASQLELAEHQHSHVRYIFTVISTGRKPAFPETPWPNPIPYYPACFAIQAPNPTWPPTQTPPCKEAQQVGISKRKKYVPPSRCATCCPPDRPAGPSSPCRWRGCARR
jgi:hypothetical protein